ncbi:hypothetical protein C2E23DRAFT_115299 [Lenzites betulinus]|nr:hypothetical protein C2E23DRAFT_115299 [Lenzites betulinus]
MKSPDVNLQAATVRRPTARDALVLLYAHDAAPVSPESITCVSIGSQAEAVRDDSGCSIWLHTCHIRPDRPSSCYVETCARSSSSSFSLQPPSSPARTRSRAYPMHNAYQNPSNSRSQPVPNSHQTRTLSAGLPFAHHGVQNKAPPLPANDNVSSHYDYRHQRIAPAPSANNPGAAGAAQPKFMVRITDWNLHSVLPLLPFRARGNTSQGEETPVRA